MTTKEKVLSKLNESNGKPVSGEALAAFCNVSRAAIWKAVTSLRNEGCQIEGTTNGGYVLNTNSDVFSQTLFEEYFYERFPALKGNTIKCFKEIDSTNTYARSLIASSGNLRGEGGQLTIAGKQLHKSIYVAEAQTAGRGRSGRTFVSPAKTGIYLSVVYAPEGGIKQAARITAFSAVAICRVIRRLYNIEPSIKWVNDIFYNGKKISGILTEGTTNFELGIIESAIIGVGINIQDNEAVFGGELSKIAGSIQGSENSVPVTRCQLAAEVAGEILSILDENAESVISEYKALSFIIGKTVTVNSFSGDNSLYTAKVLDITEDAGLKVELEDGTVKTLVSGEVSLHSENFTK